MADFSWLNSPVTRVRGVGAWHSKRLKNLGIATVSDLLRYFPSRYEDLSNIKKISDIKIGETRTLTASVKKISVRRTWKKRMFLTEAILEDETGTLRAVWFNQPFLARNIKQGAKINAAGKLVKDANGLYLSNPAYEIVERGLALIKTRISADNQRESASSLPRSERSSAIRGPRKSASLRHTGGLVPVYPETRGITSRMLRYFIQPLLAFASRLPDILPQELRSAIGLMDFQNAIQEIHFPRSPGAAERARRRFAFEDIFLLQLSFQMARLKVAKKFRGPAIPANIALVKKFLATLPFTLTDAQRKAAWEILQDMSRETPMNRLLNGEVGSGKTVVATIAALEAAMAGWQIAILAPTEILSRQNFKKISRMLASFPVKTCLLISAEARAAEEGTFGAVNKETLIANINRGDSMIVIGTHAILQQGVKFGNLGLVVVDEQHRFGVEQRAALIRGTTRTDTQNMRIPHLLSMTATPIPRTLALGLYGDLDISVLAELPKGRQKIITRIISPATRMSAYKFIRNEVFKGRQVFVVCPRIDPDKHTIEEEIAAMPRNSASSPIGSVGLLQESADWRIEVKAVKTEFEKLSKRIFPELRVAMLHGKMKSEEKESVMARFVSGATNILVSTSVVEVGVDVPNATVMMIEGSEHFGLAQLHQFRGRVGRGPHQSYCLLFTESNSRAAKKRLEALVESFDGFALAEQDLKIRGPGQFFGTQQSGLPDLAMRSLTDLPLVAFARREAIALVKKDPELKTAPLLKERLSAFRKEVHLE
jgi:ATP-dependent DNA helicase RecG